MIYLIWNKQDVEIIKKDYIKEGEYRLSNVFNRTPNAVRLMAFRLGIKKLDYRKNIHLSEVENQVILGGLLGDLYCRIKKTCKNAQIEGAHCKEQEPYLLWKINMLKSLSFSLRRNRKGYLFFASKAYPCLNYYRDIFYKNGKKQVGNEILNKINDFGLAIWYMDDGSFKKRDKYCYIHTNGFTYEENFLIKNWFINRWNIYPKIITHKDQKRYPKKIWYLLKFDVSETKKLISIIKEYIHPTMKYKMGELNDETKWETNKEEM